MSGERTHRPFATGLLGLVLLLAAAATLWGLAAIASLLFPGPSGEWSRLALLAADVVDVPVGLLTLAAGWLGRRASPRLARVALAAGAVVLFLPVFARVVWHLRWQ